MRREIAEEMSEAEVAAAQRAARGAGSKTPRLACICLGSNNFSVAGCGGTFRTAERPGGISFDFVGRSGQYRPSRRCLPTTALSGISARSELWPSG